MNCPSCSKKVNPKALRCPFCKTLFVSQEKYNEVIKTKQEKARKQKEKDYIKSGRNTLLIVGGISFIPAVVYFVQEEVLAAIIQVVFAGIFVGLGLFASKNAYVALLLGIIVYGIVIILSALGDPSSIYQGLLFKGIIIYHLVKGISHANKYRTEIKKSRTDILDDLEIS